MARPAGLIEFSAGTRVFESITLSHMPEPNELEAETKQPKREKRSSRAATAAEGGHAPNESGLLVKLGKVAGIGGISVGILFLLFLNFIRQKFLPNLDPVQGYNLLLLFLLFTFGIASAGLAVWASQIKAGGRLVVVLLLAFALAMSVLGAYVVNGVKEDLETNTRSPRNDSTQSSNYVAPESVRLQQREDARNAFESMHKRFRVGLTTVPDLVRAHEKLIETEIALSGTRQERIAVYRAALETARALQIDVENKIQMGVLATGEIYDVRRHRTETEVSLAKEQSATAAQ